MVNEHFINRMQVLVDGEWMASFDSPDDADMYVGYLEAECGVQPETIKVEGVEAGKPEEDFEDHSGDNETKYTKS